MSSIQSLKCSPLYYVRHAPGCRHLGDGGRVETTLGGDAERRVQFEFNKSTFTDIQLSGFTLHFTAHDTFYTRTHTRTGRWYIHPHVVTQTSGTYDSVAVRPSLGAAFFCLIAPISRSTHST